MNLNNKRFVDIEDLRIGNWLGYYKGNCEGRLIGMNFSATNPAKLILTAELGGWCPHQIEEVNAIRLTEQWLLKFGFTFLKKKSGTQGVYSNGTMNLSVSNSGNIYRINKPIHSVHQLQNLYFALTGKELTCQKENQKESN